MQESDEALLDWLEAQIFGSDAPADVLQRAPNLTNADAYRLRHGLICRRVAKGHRHIGYKVGGASRTIRAQEHVDSPVVGCLMESGLYSQAKPIAIGNYAKVSVEAEIVVLLKRELRGPGVTLASAMPAIDAVFPAFELLRSRSGAIRSQQMRILASNFSGAVVMGSPVTSLHGIDLRLEGMVLTLNGDVQGSATGVEVLGDPLNAVALVANTIGEYGACLEAGMIIMTGSLLGNLSVKSGDHVRASYTRLGSVSARFIE